MQKPALWRKIHQIVIITISAVFLGFDAYSAPLAIGAHRFTVEVATTPQEQETGLMNRDHLAPDAGMLFVFPSEQYASMWMKNTLIPLDMLFIDTHGAIVFIAKNTVPESLDIISADRPVKAVLELAGGTCDKQGITIGDRVSHALFAP